MSRLQRQHGVSLIELMVALAIGSILVLGLVEVFAASRTAYQLSEGLARVQENGRFATDYLQRDIRMVGHFGCVNDQARFLTNPVGYGTSFVTSPNRTAGNFAATDQRLNYHASIEGFEATNTDPGKSLDLTAPSAGWAPALPAFISGLSPVPMAGSDIIVLRYLSAEGVPVKTFTAGTPDTTITVDKDRWANVIKSNGYTDPGLLAIADCINVTTFQASVAPTTSGTDTTITVSAAGLNQSGLLTDNFTPGQAVLYRAETAVYYIGMNSATPSQPSLYRARFNAIPGAAAVTALGGAPEELVEGIESMQLVYGVDSQTNLTKPPSGYIATQDVAKTTTPWRRVGLVQVAFLTRSANPSASIAPTQTPRLLGVNITPLPADGRYRTVYESTIALRNRLYGN